MDTRHLNLIFTTVTGLQVEANHYTVLVTKTPPYSATHWELGLRNCNMIIKEQNGVAVKLYGGQKQLTYGHSTAHVNTDYRKNTGTYLPHTLIVHIKFS